MIRKNRSYLILCVATILTSFTSLISTPSASDLPLFSSENMSSALKSKTRIFATLSTLSAASLLGLYAYTKHQLSQTKSGREHRKLLDRIEKIKIFLPIALTAGLIASNSALKGARQEAFDAQNPRPSDKPVEEELIISPEELAANAELIKRDIEAVNAAKEERQRAAIAAAEELARRQRDTTPNAGATQP